MSRRILITRRRQRLTLRIPIPNRLRSRKHPTKGNVENNIVIPKPLVNVAARPAVELGRGGTPVCGVGCSGSNVQGDPRSWEEPDGDVLRGPAGNEDSSADGVEAVAVALVIGGLLATANAGVAIGLLEHSILSSTLVCHDTARRRMQRYEIRRLRVDTLDNIDFTSIRPIWAKHPVRRPRSTGIARHMCNIRNEQSMIEGFVGRHTNRLAAIGWVNSLRIHTHVNRSIFNSRQALTHGSLPIDILDKSQCRVRFSEEVEFGKEVGGVVDGIESVVLSGAASNEGAQANECTSREMHFVRVNVLSKTVLSHKF